LSKARASPGRRRDRRPDRFLKGRIGFVLQFSTVFPKTTPGSRRSRTAVGFPYTGPSSRTYKAGSFYKTAAEKIF
jgi:hypothetical protein